MKRKLSLLAWVSDILAVGLLQLSVLAGWAGADAVFSKILPLWVGARGAEFSWEYLQMGMDANLRIGIYIALAALVHMQSTQGASTLLMAVAVILAMLPWLSR